MACSCGTPETSPRPRGSDAGASETSPTRTATSRVGWRDLRNLTAASLDEPAGAPSDAVDYDEWLADSWAAPMLDHALSTAAVVDGKVACFTAVETDGDRAWSGMTGTVRAHRGRGLAKLVKSIALARAAAAGIVRASTSNDARNAAMLAVNDWLGYRRVATHIGLTR